MQYSETLQIPPYKHKMFYFLFNGEVIAGMPIANRYVERPWTFKPNGGLTEQNFIETIKEIKTEINPQAPLAWTQDYYDAMGAFIVGIAEDDAPKQSKIDAMAALAVWMEGIYAKISKEIASLNTVVYNIIIKENAKNNSHNYRLEQHIYSMDEIEGINRFRFGNAYKKFPKGNVTFPN